MLGILTIIPYNITPNSNAFILKTTNFAEKFYSIFRKYMKFPKFKKKKGEPQRLSIFEIIHSEKPGSLNAYEVFFRTSFGSQSVDVSQTLHKYAKTNIYSTFRLV